MQEYGDEARLRSARNFLRSVQSLPYSSSMRQRKRSTIQRIAKEGVNVLYPPNVAAMP